MLLGLREGWIFDRPVETRSIPIRRDDFSCPWCWTAPADPDLIPDPGVVGPMREDTLPAVVHDPAKATPPKKRLSAFRTRTIVFGLIRHLEQKGLMSEDELCNTINDLLDSGILKDDGRTGSFRIMPE
jgi:hypothetical protein